MLIAYRYRNQGFHVPDEHILDMRWVCCMELRYSGLLVMPRLTIGIPLLRFIELTLHPWLTISIEEYRNYPIFEVTGFPVIYSSCHFGLEAIGFHLATGSPHKQLPALFYLLCCGIQYEHRRAVLVNHSR